MEGFVGEFGAAAALGAAGSMAAGGFAKGVVGFALPLIGLSAMGSFLPYRGGGGAADRADAGLQRLPGAQERARARRGGACGGYGRLNLVLVAMIALAAQLVVALPDRLLFGLLGVAITAFGASQLAGWRPRFPARHKGGGRGGGGAGRRASSAGSRASGGRRS